MAAFLDVDEFSTWLGRSLSEGEEAIAETLLDAASDWIREHKPDIEDDNQAARYVTYDVVQAALRLGKYRGMVSFSRTTGNRSESGTLAGGDALGALDFTGWHRELLGIGSSAVAGPSYSFPVCDY